MLLPWAPTDMLDLSSCTPEPPAEHYQVRPSSTPGPVCLVASRMFSVQTPNIMEPQPGARP